MSDGELEKIGRRPEDLTEWARETLRAEMVRRGLEWREVPPARREMPDDTNVLVALRFYPDVAEAAEVKALLKQGRIESYFFGETSPGPEGLISWVPGNGVRLLVRVSELAKSLELLREGDHSEAAESKNSAQALEDEGKGGKPVVLRRYRDITEAMVDRTTLESAGIECFLYDDNLVRLDWFVSNMVGGVKVVVSQRDLAEAEKILAEARPLEEQ
jgi:hypothetical protein